MIQVWLPYILAGILIPSMGFIVRGIITHAREIARLSALHRGEVDSKKETDDKIGRLETNFNTFQIHVARNYVHRDDHVPSFTSLIMRIDALAEIVARIDERTKSLGNHSDD